MELSSLKSLLETLPAEYHAKAQDLEEAYRKYKEKDIMTDAKEAKEWLSVKAVNPGFTLDQIKREVESIMTKPKLELLTYEVNYHKAKAEYEKVDKQIMLTCKLSDLFEREIALGLHGGDLERGNVHTPDNRHAAASPAAQSATTATQPAAKPATDPNKPFADDEDLTEAIIEIKGMEAETSKKGNKCWKFKTADNKTFHVLESKVRQPIMGGKYLIKYSTLDIDLPDGKRVQSKWIQSIILAGGDNE